ncbi:HAD-IB family phosphatase [Candidatus Woesearchaeota archaeon]|nr:HAD-IB family phosphatase [Candidatus Woesearchaeota archaeon]
MTKIAFFDLEGTLVKGETAWIKVRDKFGVPKEIDKEYQKLYDEGKIGFAEWRRRLAEIWRETKLKLEDFKEVLKDYELVEGAKELIEGLKKKGFKIAIITGAISIFADMVGEELGSDSVFSGHEFVFDEEGCFKDIIDVKFYRRGEGKVKVMEDFAALYGAELKDCISVGGDDINDYWMLKNVESFAVKPHISQIKEVVNHEVDKLTDILKFVK